MTTKARPRDTKDVQKAFATAIAEYERTWLNWKAFIAEKQEEQARRTATDDLDDDLLLPVGDKRVPKMAQLSAGVRQEMQGVLEARRQLSQEAAEQAARHANQPVPEQDAVYASLLQLISDELDGKVSPTGWARVWFGQGLQEFDHQAVRLRTTDSDYLTVEGASGTATTRQKVVAGIAGGVVLVAMLVLAFNVLFGATPTRAGAVMTVQVGQTPVPAWPVQTLAIGAVTGPATVRNAGGYPLIVCVSSEQQPALHANATLVLTGTDAVRSYRVSSVSTDTTGDLIAASCDGAVRPLWAALLTDVRTRRTLPPETIMGITTLGPDTNPIAIPTNLMQVTLSVTEPRGAQGTLVLADGTRWSPTHVTPRDTGMTLTYLVPLLPTAQTAGWELPAVGGDLPGMATVNLPAPTVRSTLLHRVLAVRDSPAVMVQKHGDATLALTLTVSLSADSDPLALVPTDLQLVRNGTVQDVPVWTPPTLQPGTSTTIALLIPLGTQPMPLELGLGDWRRRYRWNTEGGT